MRKIIVIAVCCVALLSGCSKDAKDYVVETDAPIPTELAGLQIGEKYTKKQMTKTLSSYTEKYFEIMDEDKIGSGHLYDCAPSSLFWSEDFQFAGSNWTYVRLLVDKQNVLTSICFTVSSEEYEPLTGCYGSLKSSLSEKYGKAREYTDKQEAKNKMCSWTDGKMMLVLSIDESITKQRGATRSFCCLTYSNIKLTQALERSGTSEL